MNTSPAHRAILLPGSVLPATPAYGALISSLHDRLGESVHAVSKDLEVYASPTPPPDYSLDTEAAGVARMADALGWETFHLVGYSGGGASVLAFAAKHPERLESLALLEPAWAGNWGWSPAHRALWEQYQELEGLEPDEFMARFVRLGVRPGVTAGLPVPGGEQPPWMALRPAGIRAFLTTFATYDLDRDVLTRFDKPVYFALGALSNPDDYGEIADRLSGVFPRFRLEVFPGRHHFDPPHRTEPDHVAASLARLWAGCPRASGMTEPTLTGEEP
ncbi:alpha/beta hydrolase [Sinomonas sp. ASV486]|uniref:Alpha/beta fold hydrolase n=1 Tax=Sinomonas puerhi TaxID=3238584 RepID=A0AB39L2V2_9MICC|nr:alpha/beta hydrolase [Sinomonas sp. ASV486]MDQ4492086.1 alpha/beta hydrolase [Sinomonas sp. ASV486]